MDGSVGVAICFSTAQSISVVTGHGVSQAGEVAAEVHHELGEPLPAILVRVLRRLV